jgi:hypothetical protein
VGGKVWWWGGVRHQTADAHNWWKIYGVGPLMRVGRELGVMALWPGNCISTCFYSCIKIFCLQLYRGAKKLGFSSKFCNWRWVQGIWGVLAGCFFGQLFHRESLITENQLHKWWSISAYYKLIIDVQSWIGNNNPQLHFIIIKKLIYCNFWLS